MRTISLEHFYANIGKCLKLVESYTGQKGLAYLMQACRLKPQPLLSGQLEKKTILHRWWFDEFGNSFEISKNKRIRLTFNDFRLNKEKIIGTDLYENLSIDKAAKMAKLAYFLFSKDEDELQPHIIISFLGIDDFLRTYALAYGEWKTYPSLNLGMKVLRSIIKNRDIKYFTELHNKETVLYPCTKQKSYLTFWSPSKDFISVLKKQDEYILDILNKGK